MLGEIGADRCDFHCGGSFARACLIASPLWHSDAVPSTLSALVRLRWMRAGSLKAARLPPSSTETTAAASNQYCTAYEGIEHRHDDPLEG